MACPYFYPLEPRGGAPQGRETMLPLGGSWSGVCRAVAGGDCRPDERAMLSLCNLGYARGQCSRFPEGDGPDAARFTISHDDGERLHLYYVLERDHHPFAHGAIEYSRNGGAVAGSTANDEVRRQASAYAESYLRLKTGSL